MDVNRERKITNIHISKLNCCNIHPSLYLGTIMYGTIVPKLLGVDGVEERGDIFIVEDLYYYRGISMKQYTLGEKLGYLEQFFIMNNNYKNHSTMIFLLPFLWALTSPAENDIHQDLENHRLQIPYPIHHIQIRKLNELSPYININLNNVLSKICHRNSNRVDPISIPILKNIMIKNYSKPQYKYPTVFLVSADMQYDIYHLFAYGRDKEHVYYDIAYIQNIKKSMWMNSLFRKIRENRNLDFIEESDDEDDFEDISADKYVD